MTELRPVDFTDHTVDVNGVTIHYAQTEPTGPAMVMLHGIGMDWRVWQAISRRLAPFFTLYLIDMRGHGWSDKPRHGYSLGHYASDIEELIQRLGLTDIALVGSSLGGMVALAVEASTTTVSHRVLVDPPLVRGSGPKRPLFERILKIKQSGAGEEDQHQEIFRALHGEGEGAGNVLIRYMAEAWTVCAPGVLEEALKPVETPGEIDAAMSAIETPTLIIRGNPDRGSVLSPSVAQHALSVLPLGEMAYFPNSGHAIHGSEPARFVETVQRFVAGSPVGA